MSFGETRVYEDDTYGQVFKNAELALQDCDFRTTMSDINTGTLKATSGMTLTSFGETINIKIVQGDDGVEVTITASPYTWDIGNSRQDVEDFFNALDDRLDREEEYAKFQQTGAPSREMFAGVSLPPGQSPRSSGPMPTIKARRVKQKKTLGYLFFILGLLLLITLPSVLIFRGIPAKGGSNLMIAFILTAGFLIIGWENIKQAKQ